MHDGGAEGDLIARRYRLIEPVGAGGTATVWKAVDERLARTVAVKVVSAATAPVHSLHAEARNTAQVEHPGAVQIYDCGEAITTGGRVIAFTVMPLLAGELLASRLARGRLPVADAVAIAADIADVLAATHARGVVHQDVSSENVLVTPVNAERTGARLLDFGLAGRAGQPDKRTSTTGTPPYVAPERLDGAPADPAADVYALGVLLFEMLTGHRPSPVTTWDELERAHKHRAVPPHLSVRGLPPEIAALCRNCLSPDPSERPTAATVHAGLRQAMKPQLSRRIPASVAAVLSIGALLAGVLVTVHLSGTGDGGGSPTPADRQLPRADANAPLLPVPQATVLADDGAADADTAEPADPQGPDSSDGQDDSAAEPRHGSDGTSAVDHFRLVLDEGRRSGSIRPDVALDLAQLADEFGHSRADDPRRHVAELRNKIDARLREGALTENAHTRLDTALSGVITEADAREAL